MDTSFLFIITGWHVALMSVEVNDGESCMAPLVFLILLAYSTLIEF